MHGKLIRPVKNHLPQTLSEAGELSLGLTEDLLVCSGRWACPGWGCACLCAVSDTWGSCSGSWKCGLLWKDVVQSGAAWLHLPDAFQHTLNSTWACWFEFISPALKTFTTVLASFCYFYSLGAFPKHSPGVHVRYAPRAVCVLVSLNKSLCLIV